MRAPSKPAKQKKKPPARRNQSRKKEQEETIKIWKTVTGFLKDAFREQYHPLNPAPEVMEKLKQKGYSFEFNVMSTGFRGPVIKIWTVTSPQGLRLNNQNTEEGRQAAEQYRADYEHAVKECNPAP